MSAKKSAKLDKPISHLLYPRSSSFYALANCELSFSLSQQSGEEPPTPFSDSGTVVHGLISGKIDPSGAEEGLLEEAQALKSRQFRFFDQWLAPGFQLVRERRLWVRAGLKPIYSGAPDVWARSGEVAALSDFKTGWHPLDEYTATNCQIRAYAGLIHFETNRELELLVAAIHKPGKEPDPARFDKAALDDALDWSIQVASNAIAFAAKAKGKPSRGPWCKFCSGKVLCPLWRDELSSLATYSNLSLDDLPDHQLRAIAPKLAICSQVVERLLARLKARVAQRPDFFVDWRLAPGEERRKISDTVAAYNQLVVREKKLSAGEFLVACRVAITEIESRLRRKNALGVRQAKTLLNSLLEGIIESKPTAPSLVYDPKPSSNTDPPTQPLEQ